MPPFMPKVTPEMSAAVRLIEARKAEIRAEIDAADDPDARRAGQVEGLDLGLTCILLALVNGSAAS